MGLPIRTHQPSRTTVYPPKTGPCSLAVTRYMCASPSPGAYVTHHKRDLLVITDWRCPVQGRGHLPVGGHRVVSRVDLDEERLVPVARQQRHGVDGNPAGKREVPKITGASRPGPWTPPGRARNRSPPSTRAPPPPVHHAQDRSRTAHPHSGRRSPGSDEPTQAPAWCPNAE